MAERGIMIVLAPDGGVVAAIETDAREAGRYAEMAFRQWGTGQPARTFAHMTNLMYWTARGRPEPAFAAGDELLEDIAFYPGIADADADAVANHAEALHDSGYTDAVWVATTWNGTVAQRKGSSGRRKPARSHRSTKTPACTCRKR